MRYKVPLGATRAVTLGSPSHSSNGRTMTAYGKNVDTGEIVTLGSTDGDVAGEDVVLNYVCSAANGLAVGDEVALQANDGVEVFLPNYQEPDEVIFEIIELME